MTDSVPLWHVNQTGTRPLPIQAPLARAPGVGSQRTAASAAAGRSPLRKPQKAPSLTCQPRRTSYGSGRSNSTHPLPMRRTLLGKKCMMWAGSAQRAVSSPALRQARQALLRGRQPVHAIESRHLAWRQNGCARRCMEWPRRPGSPRTGRPERPKEKGGGVRPPAGCAPGTVPADGGCPLLSQPRSLQCMLIDVALCSRPARSLITARGRLGGLLTSSVPSPAAAVTPWPGSRCSSRSRPMACASLLPSTKAAGRGR